MEKGSIKHNAEKDSIKTLAVVKTKIKFVLCKFEHRNELQKV